MGMKSFSTMSITAEMEKEDKIRELESVVDDQRSIIEHQNQRIHQLETVVQEINQQHQEYPQQDEVQVNGNGYAEHEEINGH